MQMQPRVSPQTFLWRREELISNLKFLASLIMLYARLIMQASDLLLYTVMTWHVSVRK